MSNRCPDCRSKNQNYREYCVHCGGKLTHSHRSLHIANNARAPRFVLDKRVGS